jgi:SAM-dependent methyltransferase
MNQNQMWNSEGGQGWVMSQSLLDRMFKPFEDLLVSAVSAAGPRYVLDVGCGTGATTVAIARRLGPDSRCVGIDISQPMILAARSRAEKAGVTAGFICADAETYGFDATSVDMIVSRFGVMFFADPVSAFANLRGAARDGAMLRCIVWRSPAENPFMTAAEQAAEPSLPGVSERLPNEPGQFGFADRDHVQRILTESGWREINIAPLEVQCVFPASELERYVSSVGPVGRSLQRADDNTRTRVIQAVLPAFDPYVHGTEVRFTAACWIVGAHARTS